MVAPTTEGHLVEYVSFEYRARALMAKRCLEGSHLAESGKMQVGVMNEAARKLAKWYVVQVRTGAEMVMCVQIERACAEHDERVSDAGSRVDLDECFSPRYITQKKWKGDWKNVERNLLPGYVIAVTKNPERLVEAMRGIGDLCRLLNDGETYVPLSEHERLWMESKTNKGDRVLPISFARKVGEKLEVTAGPLEGHEAQIVKIDRSNSVAHLEFHVGQMRIKTKVGLAILPS